MATPLDPGPSQPRRPRAFAGLLAALALALLWTPGVSEAHAWGWDESVHAELPAVHMLTSATMGDVGGVADAILGCHQYPFAYPVVLAASQGIFGVSETVARRTGRVVWALALFGLFLLVREALSAVERARGSPLRGARAAPWLALVGGAASPLGMSLSGMLFLEVPFACAATFTLWWWIRRTTFEGTARLRAELLAGAWVTLCFFTKFNYGLLLALGLGLDVACDFVPAFRRGHANEFAKRLAVTSLVPVLALLWWFVLPLPGDFEVAATHREKFVGFILGNTDVASIPWHRRVLGWTTRLVVSPRAMLLFGAGIAATLLLATTRGTRTLWLVALAFVVPTTMHNFYQDRFLLPASLSLFALASIGWARMLPRSPAVGTAVAALVAVLVSFAPTWDGELLAARMGLLPETDTPEIAAYKREVLARSSDLRPWRPLTTGGLLREELDGFLDLAAEEVGSDECPGWIGISSELAPGAFFTGLVERGWSRASFHAYADDEPGERYITMQGADPQWSEERLTTFLEPHDVLFYTEPIDVKNRRGRAFMESYRDRVLARGWQARELGSVDIARPLREPLSVRLFAARPPE